MPTTVKHTDRYTDEVTTLEVTDCCTCGVVFALPKRLLDNRREKGGNFYCPNGHTLIFAKTEVEKLRERAESLKAQVTSIRDQKEATERSNAALRGQATKLRKRISSGVCPCCGRTFKQLAAHMENKHPEYATSEG